MNHDSSVLKLRLAYETDENSERTELIEFGKQYGLIGESPTFLGFLKEIRDLATLRHTVLLTGETGTGKELAAKALHGERRGPLIPVNCSSLMGEMAGVAFTGYRKNSFTGSDKADRDGLFVNAREGTLFLDEIQLLPNSVQQQLLRVLETKKILPFCGFEEANVSSVRVVAASNTDIASLVTAGKFRQDLYFRINIFIVRLPPLRERQDDIPLLAQYFVDKYREEFDSSAYRVSDYALELMEKHTWPGNVRELEHVIMTTLAHKRDGDYIETSDLPPLVPLSLPAGNELLFQHQFSKIPTFEEARAAVEMFAIRMAMKATNQNVLNAAMLLQVSKATVNRRLQEHGMRVQEAT